MSIYLPNINTESVKLIPAKREDIDKCPLFKDCLIDVHKATEIIDKLPDNKQKLIINFLYSHVNSGLYLIIYNGKSIIVEELTINEKKIEFNLIIHLNHYYKKHILDIVKDNFGKQEFEEFFLFSKVMNSVFLLPLFEFITSNSIHLIIAQNLKSDEHSIFFDLSCFADLRYRFSLIEKNDDLLISNVTYLSIYDFIYKLSSVPFPLISSFVLLYGLKKQDTEEDLMLYSSNKEKNEAIIRENIYQKTFELINQQGSRVYELSGINQFEQLFRTEFKGTVIQILTHFHHERLFTKDLKTIRFKQIENLIDNLVNEKQLRDDIMIDAIACSNYFSFSKLYDKNIKYLFSSHHDLSNNLASFMLYEFYSCHNAKILNWKVPYIDGKTYIHEAWSNITRCFYTMMNKYNQISIP